MLILAVGDAYRAKGMLLTAWELAQQYWLAHRGVPIDKWPDELNVLIETKFARTETRDSEVFVYVNGSKEACAFLEKQSAAGKVGGKSRSKKKLASLKQNQTSETKPKRNRNQNNPTEVSYSFSNSYSFSDSSTDSHSGSDLQSPPTASDQPRELSPVATFIVGYKARFFAKYGAVYDWQDKDSGIAARVTKKLSNQKVNLYLDAFFSMPDTWLEKTKHPVGAFETKQTEIQVFAQTGTFTTNRQAQSKDVANTNLTLLAKVRGGGQ